MKTRKSFAGHSHEECVNHPSVSKPQAKHTQGPWTMTDKFNAGGKEIGISAPHPQRPGRKYTLATVHERFEGEEKANARLIACAPELLNALKWAEVEIRHSCDLPDAEGMVVAPDSLLRVKLAEVQALIAKAEGRI